MSNKTNSLTKEVKFRIQTRVNKKIVESFQEECKQRRWGPGELLRTILEERYDVSRQ